MYYVVYDIHANELRLRTIQILKDHGLVRIQKSVFCGKLSHQNKKDILESVKQVIASDDSFYILTSCKVCFGKIDTIGRGFDKEYVQNLKKGMVV